MLGERSIRVRDNDCLKPRVRYAVEIRKPRDFSKRRDVSSRVTDISACDETGRITRNCAYLAVFDTDAIDYVHSRTGPLLETAVRHRSREAGLVLSGSSFAGHRGG